MMRSRKQVSSYLSSNEDIGSPSMNTVPSFALTLLDDALINAAPNALHGLDPDGLHAFADKSLEVLFD
jgi:hypothetical protein